VHGTVIKIEKAKDLKKTISTKTNLLVFYSNGKTPEITNAMNVLKTVDGTIAFVDCSNKELKKSMCKKALSENENYSLKHYKDGQFNKNFDRQMTKNSIQSFLKDPNEIPFEEESSAKDVVHLLDVSVGTRNRMIHNYFIKWLFFKNKKFNFLAAAMSKQ
jgi:hypothetical protein